MQVQIGGLLANLLSKSLRYKVGKREYLLLKPQTLRKGVKSEGYLVFNKAFLEKFVTELDKVHDLSLQLERSLPMIYRPAPWKNNSFGGFYLKQTNLAKVAPYFKEAINYLHRADLSRLCAVLDDLSLVPWKVNRDILESMEYVWSIGGGLGKIPKRFNERVVSAEMIREAGFREKLKLLKEHQQNQDNHGLRCGFLLRLSMAQGFAPCQKIYFPHNMDFRGRVYPIPPHLNHMGDDLNRGLLSFSEAKPLGEHGLRWLKIHLANVIGQDKLPLDDRAAYADSIMEAVHRCADDPKKNLDWLDSDNPW